MQPGSIPTLCPPLWDPGKECGCEACHISLRAPDSPFPLWGWGSAPLQQVPHWALSIGGTSGRLQGNGGRRDLLSSRGLLCLSAPLHLGNSTSPSSSHWLQSPALGELPEATLLCLIRGRNANRHYRFPRLLSLSSKGTPLSHKLGINCSSEASAPPGSFSELLDSEIPNNYPLFPGPRCGSLIQLLLLWPQCSCFCLLSLPMPV